MNKPNSRHPNDEKNPPPLHYWQVNVPPHQRTPSCPEFLLGVSEKDQHILSIPDAEYTLDSWEAVKHRVLVTNRLDEFKRVPSQLRAYLEYTYRLRRDSRYEGVGDYILKERVGWDRDELQPRTGAAGKRTPFNCEDDVKILHNDWPYGIDERIVHLVVWTKFALEEDTMTRDLTEEARRVVDLWVRERFTSRSGITKAPREDQVIWFKNWSSLKSVHSVEHFHVMLFDPDPGFVSEVTAGDVPLWRKRRAASEQTVKLQKGACERPY